MLSGHAIINYSNRMALAGTDPGNDHGGYDQHPDNGHGGSQVQGNDV